MLYVVVYDVDDDQVRDRVRELLKNWGGTRVQYSAFHLELEEPQLVELLQIIERLIEGSNAQVTAIPVCRADQERAIWIGPKLREENVF